MPQIPPPTLPLRAGLESDGTANPKHYENFPVASWLCPPHLRGPIAAIYAFARTADDIADEGDASAQQRLDDLAVMSTDLHSVNSRKPHSGRWPDVFDAMNIALVQFNLPVNLLTDLLDAFAQDVAKTRDGTGYANQTELLDYCRRSANPVGRLLLHLYQVSDSQSLLMSDNICTALQLINFWQDLSRDLPRGRYYLPAEECGKLKVTQAQLLAGEHSAPVLALIGEQVRRAKALMQEGAPLVRRIPGRAGWELRLVVQSGLRIIAKMERMGYATLTARPKITPWDGPAMLWRCLFM